MKETELGQWVCTLPWALPWNNAWKKQLDNLPPVIWGSRFRSVHQALSIP